MPDKNKSILGIGTLIEQGEKFTYGNFSTKGSRGFPNAYTDDWLIWTYHVNELMRQLTQSPIASSIAAGLSIELLGNDDDAFVKARNMILSGLKAADRIFGQPIPASDRVVSAGHNSPEQSEAIRQLDHLIKTVEETNDFPGDPEDKERIVAELSAGRKILEASKVRIAALGATLGVALKWVAEKAAGASIGKLAGNLVDYLASIKWL